MKVQSVHFEMPVKIPCDTSRKKIYAKSPRKPRKARLLRRADAVAGFPAKKLLFPEKVVDKEKSAKDFVEKENEIEVEEKKCTCEPWEDPGYTCHYSIMRGYICDLCYDDYCPTSPAYCPTSPAYCPTSPALSPSSPKSSRLF